MYSIDFYYAFRPFLNASKRELLADCALPVSVLLMSFFGSFIFKDVKRRLTEHVIYRNYKLEISTAPKAKSRERAYSLALIQIKIVRQGIKILRLRQADSIDRI